MYRIGVRRFTTTAWKAAETAAQMEGPNPYGIKVSTAQGIVKGLVGGELNTELSLRILAAS
jgi:cysteine synthase A